MVVIKDFRNMFWGVTIDGGKRYSQMVERSFHISMAALEPSSAKGCVSVLIQHEKAEFLLCSLDPKTMFQQALDLNFTEGEEVTFFLNNTGVVHLTGFLIEEEEEDSDEFRPITDSEEEMECSDEEVPELVPSGKSKDIKRKLEGNFSASSTKKKKQQQQQFADESFDSESDSDDADFDGNVIEDEAAEDSEQEDSDEIPDDDFSEDEDDDFSEEEAAKTPEPVSSSKKSKKLAKQEKQTTPKQKPSKDVSAKSTPTADKSVTKTPSSEKPPVSEGETTEGKKKKKKKKKKNKVAGDESTANGSTLGTPKMPTSVKKGAVTPQKRVVAGGTVVEEVWVGHGPEAKAGKMVHVYYSGKLTSGKPFDSCTSGKPFRFKLGKSEVIKGWDSGLAGMKVGGKRKITVPPQQGYGNQRQGPIPPNSTLVFEVELKAVS